MIHAGIVGATGYAGSELVRLLLSHPEISVPVISMLHNDPDEIFMHSPEEEKKMLCRSASIQVLLPSFIPKAEKYLSYKHFTAIPNAVPEAGVQAHPGEKKEEYVVKKAQEYMEKHCSEQLLLSDIAAQFHLHPNYFSSLFKKQLDMTVRDYILQLRMTKAKELMKDSSLKLLDIALAVGYEDAAHFNRAFKNVTGVSPSMYRDGIKKQ